MDSFTVTSSTDPLAIHSDNGLSFRLSRMPDSADDHDSRTATVGVTRNSRGNSNDASRPSSIDPVANPRKRQRKDRRSSENSRDFVPQGASFSANPVDVDPDLTSSSGSSSEGDSDSDSHSDTSDEENKESPEANPDTARTANWNKGSKSTIRTTLGSRTTKPEESKKSSQFDAINSKYWRSRSESVSSADANAKGGPQSHGESTEEGEVSEGDDSTDSSQMELSGDSDDSSLDSDADDSILLNLGSRNHNQSQNGVLSPKEGDDYDPEALPLSGASVNGQAINRTRDDSAVVSKEDAFRHFSQKYPTPPLTLADLNQTDMDLQAKSIFYDRNINDINLQLPVACAECLREGHMAEVCPFKECVHCGEWDKHQSSFCPQWRRCQRCRARGHDEQQCPSPLKSSASEIPCDLCGSRDHLELQCDYMWKLPRQDPTAAPVHVSISCAHCLSSHHLLGDCPSLSKRLVSSSWTLEGIDLNMVTNINSIPRGRANGGPVGAQRGMKIRGRAERYSAGSSDSEDMLARPDRRPPMGRNANANRPNIRIGGIGKNKNFAPPPPPGPRASYRDRQEFPSGNSRQRSLSPDPRPGE
ncbi:hypothetical protein FE257_002930 [Aspergillus nanangensis]|uniref:CCHC-type domain-containing protein n=1 Tax=Aspergillus nanangensis TaxID=2582783 RepID=A0AAD4CT23_ASPNN|nr:hypothetical protein FE257_002930 [Aspergillus nanangensis]